MPISYHCSNCSANLTWRIYRTPRLANCPHCGVALNRGSVEKAFWTINFACGFWSGLSCAFLLGMLGGLFVIAGIQQREVSIRTLGWILVGVGLTLWATCFVWHDQCVRRALDRPGGWFRSFTLWLTLVMALPVLLALLAAFLLAVYFGWSAIAPWLNKLGIGASTFAWLFVIFFALVLPLLVLTGRAVYRKIQRALTGSRTRPTKADPIVQAAHPARQTPARKSIKEENLYLGSLLLLCHHDRAMCERLIEHERSKRPHLSRSELVELAEQKLRADKQ